LLPIIVNLVAFVIDGISGIIEFITNLVTIIADLPGQVSDFFTQVNQTGQAALDALGSAVMSAFTFIQGIIGTVIGAVTGFITGFGSAASSVFTSIQTVASNVVSSIGSFFSGLASNLASIASTIYSSVTGAFNNIVDTIRSIPERIVGFFSGLGSRITSAIGSIHFPQPSVSFENVEIGPTSFPIPHISWYAQGGIVDGATLIGAGEAGPEMILPKSGGLMTDFAEAVASQENDEELIRWLSRNLGAIIHDNAPTISRRDFDRMARGAIA
jgi:predicted PurR-regulated permease PerM